jgi:hypothetical protein
VAADGVRFILATFVDLNGKPCAKLVPAEAVDMLATDGAGFAGYAAGALGQQPSDPDLMAMPDPASYTSLSFLRPGLAMVHCDPFVAGEPWPFAPRVILRAVVDRLAARGLTAQVGAEAAVSQPAPGLDRPGRPAHQDRGTPGGDRLAGAGVREDGRHPGRPRRAAGRRGRGRRGGAGRDAGRDRRDPGHVHRAHRPSHPGRGADGC